MNSFKIDDMVVPVISVIDKSDLGEEEKKFVRSKQGKIFKVIGIDEEDDKELYKIRCDDGSVCTSPFYFNELSIFNMEWDK